MGDLLEVVSREKVLHNDLPGKLSNYNPRVPHHSVAIS